MPTLEEIPDEILQHILFYVSPEDNLSSVQSLSRRFNLLANSAILWRHHCQLSFTFWRDEHRFSQKLTGRVFEVDWKAIFILRKSQNARIARLFDQTLSSNVGRIGKYEHICSLGHDAKDFLVEQSQTIDTADDVLARRYHSNAALASLRRELAIKVWLDLPHQPATVPEGMAPHPDTYKAVERALAAYDMFVIGSDTGNFEDITHRFDEIAHEFRVAHPDFEHSTTREKALALNWWLRAKNLTGMDNPATDYRNLRNCFIGHALRDEQHPSLPLISAAIYCCVAGRLGLNAHCCAVPGHVHAMIYAAQDTTLNGDLISESQDRVERMYLDPFSSDYEVTRDTLHALLVRLGWHRNEALLEPMTPATIVTRMAANINATISNLPRAETLRIDGRFQLLPGSLLETVELAGYAASWADLLVTNPRDPVFRHRGRDMGVWLHNYRDEDYRLIDRYLAPLCRQLIPVGNMIPPPATHSRPRMASLRPPDMPLCIGQVVRTRYMRYEVIIARVFSRDKPFCLTIGDETSPHVSMPENVQLVTDSSLLTDAMFPRAGAYFKRFNRDTCTFVPIQSLEDEYPEG